MFNDDEYEVAYHSESWGPSGSLGVKIMLVIDRELTDNDRNAARKACDKIREALQEETMALDPKTAINSAKERTDIIGLFDGSIYVEEIPNEYDNSWAYKHLPWFRVTTKIGHVKIGWRTRVIFIDWSETGVNKTAEEMFPHEDVSKYEREIHAWSLEDAKKYLTVIFGENNEKA